jgi:competence protein ComEC
MVLAIDYQNTHLVLPADIDQPLEERIFAGSSWPGRVLLIAPHHGSGRSNGNLLLDRLQPQAATFSCGYANWFGFPAKDVLERYQRRRIPCYRTDLHGAVLAQSDGQSWQFFTARGVLLGSSQ